MTKAFWILTTIDALSLLVLLTVGLTSRGHNDGGREMALAFYVILPLVLLGLTVLLFWFFPLPLVRWFCLAAAGAPLVFVGYVTLARFGVTFVNDPAYAYQDPSMRNLVRAIHRLDVEEVKRWAPQMDKTINQGDVSAPLRLTIDKMVQEQKARIPARTEPHLAILKALLDNGARPNEAMQVACWTRSAQLFTWMFQAGADPNYVTEYGGPVFFSCLDSGLGVPGSVLPVVKTFVAAGVDVNKPSNIGLTPAHYAFDCGNFDAALYLLDHGADPDAPGGDYGTLRNSVRRKMSTAGAGAPPELVQLSHRLSQ